MKANAEQLQLNADFEKCSPLFRWAGGKRRLISQIIPVLPQKYNKYYEVFAGGAALFFNLKPPAAVISDKNEELINCYQQVKKNPDQVIESLRVLKNTRTEYLQVKKTSPESSVDRAARLIYLMAFSFNGLYRVNSKGEFNVPYGGKGKKAYIYDRINQVSKALASTEVMCADFALAVKEAKAGDLVYFDPPYTVAHGNNGFVQYNEKIFSWSDQERLAIIAKSLTEKGCHVIISNADHSSISELYKNFRKRIVQRHSGIGGLTNSRKVITEFVFFN